MVTLNLSIDRDVSTAYRRFSLGDSTDLQRWTSSIGSFMIESGQIFSACRKLVRCRVNVFWMSRNVTLRDIQKTAARVTRVNTVTQVECYTYVTTRITGSPCA